MAASKFDADALIVDCLAAAGADQPTLAVRDVLERVLAEPTTVSDALGRDQGGIESIYTSDQLTVLNFVWAPGMRLYPHNHNMWAVIGIYGGAEDNAFFRRDGDHLVRSKVTTVAQREVLLMGDDAIHSVANPRSTFTGSIHVYGGNFFTQPRSEWDPDTLADERPYDVEHTRRVFAEANERVRADEADRAAD